MSTNKTALSAVVLASLFTVPAFAQTSFAGNADVALADSVHHAIEARPALAGNQIHVRVAGGTVYLTGSVDTQMESTLAETAAQKVDGVRKVVNATSVTSGAN